MKTENFPIINQDKNAHIKTAYCALKKVTIKEKHGSGLSLGSNVDDLRPKPVLKPVRVAGKLLRN